MKLFKEYIYQPGNGDELPRICNLSKGKGI